MRSVIYVPDETVWQRAGTPGGLSLLERQLEQLAALGLDPPVLLVRGDGPVPVLSAGPVPGEVWRLPAGVSSVFAAVRAAVEVLPAEFVFVSADLLVDSRVLRGLLAGRGCLLGLCFGLKTEFYIEAKDAFVTLDAGAERPSE